MTEWLDAPRQWAGQIGLNVYALALVLVAAFAIAGAFIGLAAGRALQRILRHWLDGAGAGLVQLTRRTIFGTATLTGLILAAMLVGFSPQAEAIVIAVLKTLLIFMVSVFLIAGGRLLIDALSRRPAPPPWARPAAAPLLSNLLRVLLVLAA